MIRQSVFAVVGPLLVGLCITAVADDALVVPRNIKSVFNEKVLPAYQRDDVNGVIDVLSPLVQKLPEEHIAALDALLAQNSMPSVQQLLTDGRVTLMRLGQSGKLPTARGRELRLVAEALDERIRDMLIEAKGHPAMAERLPTVENIEEYNDVFWSIHVLSNQLTNAFEAASFAHTLTQARGLSDEDLETLPDFQRRRNIVLQVGNRLNARRLELHLQRLELAVKTLGESDDIRERIFAAYSVDFDTDVLIAFAEHLAENSDEQLPLGERLRSDKLKPEIEQLSKTGQLHARDIREKSQLFFDGLHWWMRGRYGRGVEQGGLMKSRFALVSPQAQMALFMPTEPPTPVDPFVSSQYQTPEVDRRHHYLWATEQPRFVTTTTYFM